MSNLVIVAIPEQDDYVWKISSEKVPHMTILYLGDPTKTYDVGKMIEFLEHASDTVLDPFWLNVEDRGTLGDDEADVVFFEGWDIPVIKSFRAQLLQNECIRKAYDSADQHPEWLPHLTLGYPDNPAKPDDREYPGIRSIRFNKIALWYGNYEGVEFKLKDNYDYPLEVAMSDVRETGLLAVSAVLQHHGVKGMKWGFRKSPEERAAKRVAKADKVFEKSASGLGTKINIHNRAAELANKDLETINNKPEYKQDFTKLGPNWESHPVYQKYEKEVMDSYMTRVREAAAEIGTNASGTRKLHVEEAPDFLGFSVSTKAVGHAATEKKVKVRAVKDSTGHITELVVENSLAQAVDFVEGTLSHHGVKGMKWGVRKDRKGSSEPTVEQKGKNLKAKGGTGHTPHEDAVTAASLGQKAKASGLHSLSNDELFALQTRMNLEQNVRRLNSGQSSGGKKFVADILKQVGKNQVQRLATEVATRQIDKALKKK